MFSALNVSQLIADNLCPVDFCVDVGVRVSIYPHINPAISDIVMQIHRKCGIERTPFMMRRNNCHCRKMMSHHHDMLCIALGNTLLDEGKTFLMLIIEVARQKVLPSISNLIKVAHTLPDSELICGIYARPQSAKNEVSVINSDNLVLVIVYIRENLTAPAVTILQHITEAVVFMIAWY